MVFTLYNYGTSVQCPTYPFIISVWHHVAPVCRYICDWIWGKSDSMYNYKYLEVLIINIWNSYCISGRKTDAYMQFATVLYS